MRLCDGPDFYRRTTEPDEQGGYVLPVKTHAAAPAKAGRSAAEIGRKAAESGNKDPDAGRAEKRAGIPERDALGPPDACPEEGK